MGWVEAIVMPEVRFAGRCWVSVAGVEEDIVVVRAGDDYVVGTALDDWYMVPVEAVRRFLAKLLGASEEDVSLEYWYGALAVLQEAERALRAVVPTAWLVAGGRAFAVVRFPQVAEPGEWWVERLWVAVPWVFANSLFGVEVVFKDVRFTAVACPHYGERLAEVEEVHVLLNTEPPVDFRLHDEAVQWLRGWTMALRDETVKKKAVEKARRVKHCCI